MPNNFKWKKLKISKFLSRNYFSFSDVYFIQKIKGQFWPPDKFWVLSVFWNIKKIERLEKKIRFVGVSFRLRSVSKSEISYFNPQAPAAQKIAYQVVFRHYQGEGVEFFKADLTDPFRFVMRIFWKLPI